MAPIASCTLLKRTLRAPGRMSDPRPRHTKGIKMILATPLLTLTTKVSARKIQEGR